VWFVVTYTNLVLHSQWSLNLQLSGYLALPLAIGLRTPMDHLVALTPSAQSALIVLSIPGKAAALLELLLWTILLWTMTTLSWKTEGNGDSNRAEPNDEFTRNLVVRLVDIVWLLLLRGALAVLGYLYLNQSI
jgi:hypothetical protein